MDIGPLHGLTVSTNRKTPSRRSLRYPLKCFGQAAEIANADSGEWSDNDYDVFDGEQHIGHILRTYFGQIVAGSRTANCDFSHFTFPRLGLIFNHTQGE